MNITTGTRERSRIILFVITVLCAVASAHWFVPRSAAVWLALIAIAVGIWHGAFDGVLAEEALEPLLGRRWKLAFYPIYLLLTALVLILWWAAPVWALYAFLLYSALHFGTEGETRLSPWRLLVGVCQGMIPIAAGCHWWPDEVAAIFRPMLEVGRSTDMSETALHMTHFAGTSLWPAATVCLVGTWLARRRAGTIPFLLLSAELVLFRMCSPVAAFAVFFCAWHTPEHLVGSSLNEANAFQPSIMFSHLRKGMGPWLLSLGAVATACWVGRHDAFADAGIVFIALSALTVPHMVLTELCRRQQGRPHRLAFSNLSTEAVLS